MKLVTIISQYVMLGMYVDNFHLSCLIYSMKNIMLYISWHLVKIKWVNMFKILEISGQVVKCSVDTTCIYYNIHG